MRTHSFGFFSVDAVSCKKANQRDTIYFYGFKDLRKCWKMFIFPFCLGFNLRGRLVVAPAEPGAVPLSNRAPI